MQIKKILVGAGGRKRSVPCIALFRMALYRSARAAALLVILVLGMLPLKAHAQSNATDAAIDGYVSDATGGALPDAHVVARNLATNVTAETLSDGSGYYRFPILKVGKYEVTVKKEGYSDLTQTGITLQVGNQVRVDAQLKVGTAGTSIVVMSDA